MVFGQVDILRSDTVRLEDASEVALIHRSAIMPDAPRTKLHGVERVQESGAGKTIAAVVAKGIADVGEQLREAAFCGIVLEDLDQTRSDLFGHLSTDAVSDLEQRLNQVLLAGAEFRRKLLTGIGSYFTERGLIVAGPLAERGNQGLSLFDGPLGNETLDGRAGFDRMQQDGNRAVVNGRRHDAHAGKSFRTEDVNC